MTNSVLIIDGFSLAFRAFYSYPTSLTLSTGEPINMVYGFMSMVFGSIDEFKPTHVVVCFDRKEPTFRHELYDQYKGHRPAPPTDFVIQIPFLKDAVRRCGFALYEKPGYEADDIMGTWAKQLDGLGIKTLLMTGDQDAFQLVTEHVTVVITKKGISQILLVTPDYIHEMFGLKPKQLIDLKALKGDTSDNVPGVAGVGEKTALALMHQFGSLDALYHDLESVTSVRIRGLLLESKPMAYLSRQLVTIYDSVLVDLDVDLVQFNPDWTAILSVFSEFRFETLVKKYKSQGSVVSGTSSPAVISVKAGLDPGDEVLDSRLRVTDSVGEYILIQSVDELKPILESLKTGFALDLETTSLQAIEAEIVGVALSNMAGKAYYVACNAFLSKPQPVAQTGLLFSESVAQVDYALNPILKVLKPLLEDETIPKITHNGKYEMLVLMNYAIQLKGIFFDTMLAAFLVFPGEKVGLKDLALRHLDVKMTSFEEVTGNGKSQILFSQVPLEVAKDYAGADADLTWRLYQFLEPKIVEKNLDYLFRSIELPVQVILADLEREGVCLDLAFLRQLGDEFTQRVEAIRKTIFELAGMQFNVSSPKQLSEVLYDKLNLPVHKVIKTGRSTDSSVLEKLAEDFEIAKCLILYRTLEKLLSTYVNALPHMIVQRTGRIHTSFNQTIAITGRLSSTNPNLQNIPARTDEGLRIRKAFIPSGPTRKILSVDYSQIELRVMAYLANDEGLIASFCAGEDIHARTAAIVNGIPIEQVTKAQRYAAKAINFGILYGQSSFGLSEQMDIQRGEAKRIIDDYFSKLPKVKAFIESTIISTRESGFVTTEFGRLRYFSDINDRVFHRRQFAERAAVNTRVQGTAADVMKLAMIAVKKKIDDLGFKSRMIIQVHDELVFDAEESELDALSCVVRETMESVVNWPVPLKVDVSVGANWAEA